MINNKGIKLGLLFLIGILLLTSFVMAYYRTQPNYVQYGPYDRTGVLGTGYFEDRKCEAGQDFILQISPLGCEPAMVRSDLLEERNAPVFCPISATQMNPLIDVEAINAISITGRYPREVATVGFFPAEAALNPYENKLTQPVILDNIGYVVIVLRKQENESAMPDYVEGNLTARIRYDIQNAFGVGQSQFYLPVLDDKDWSEKYKQYSFWNGRGYLRAEGVYDDQATISIYSDQYRSGVLGQGDNKILYSTITLREGETSHELYIPGFDFCLATMSIRLNDLENPDTRARFRVNGDPFEVKSGEFFLENNCKVENIPDSNGINSEVQFTCREDREGFHRGPINLKIIPNITLNINGQDKNVAIGDYLYDNKDGTRKVFLAYASTISNTGKEENLFAYLMSIPDGEHSSNRLSLEEINAAGRIAERLNPSDEEATILQNIKDVGEAYIGGFSLFWNWLKDGDFFLVAYYNKKANRFGTDVEVIGFAGATDSKLPQEVEEEFEKAEEDYRTLINNYPDERDSAADISLGESALLKLIKLANELNQKITMTEFCDEFEQRYPDSKESLEMCEDKMKMSSSTSSITEVLIDDHIYKISFEGVYEPFEYEYSAKIRVDYPMDKNKPSKIFTLTKNDLIYLDVSENENFKLIDLKEDSAKLNLNIRRTGTFGDLIEDRKEWIIMNTPESFSSGYTLTLTEVNLKKVAKVSLIPNIDYTQTNATFNFRVNIDKRDIQLSPEKTQEKIEKLDKAIEQWSKISKGLGKFVQTMKTACLGTSAVLTVKNYLENTGGKGIARDSVMNGENGWYTRCDDWVNRRVVRPGGKGESYRTQEECLIKESDNIDQNVDTLYGFMDTQNKEIKTIQDKYKIEGKLFSEDLINMSAVVGEYSEIVRTNLDNLGDTFEDPDGTGESINLENMKQILSAEGFEKNKYGIEQLRDIDLYTRILSEGIASNDIKKMAEQKLYYTFSDIQVNSEGFFNQESFRSFLTNVDMGFKGVSVRNCMLPMKGVIKPCIYDGGIAEQGNQWDIKKGSLIQGITFMNKNYLVVLNPTLKGTYTVKAIYDENGNLPEGYHLMGNGMMMKAEEEMEMPGADITEMSPQENNVFKYELSLGGGVCNMGSCQNGIREALEAISGVSDATVLSVAQATLTSSRVLSESEINAALANANNVMGDPTLESMQLIEDNPSKMPSSMLSMLDSPATCDMSSMDGEMSEMQDCDPISDMLKLTFKRHDTFSYKNEYKNPEVRYYETAPYKGYPAVVPFSLDEGWYVAVKQTLPVFGGIKSYDESGRVVSFYLCNVGRNGREEFIGGDDDCEGINTITGQTYHAFSGMSDKGKATALIRAASNAVEDAQREYRAGVKFIPVSTSFGTYRIKVGNPAVDVPGMKCQDFMSPKDCNTLFNVCDPVVCPSSRCNLGGNYHVQDVIQSGIIGSIALCLPNAQEGIYVPVCLTGVQAGLDGLLSLFSSYQDCLQESLDTGQTIGICDEIQSVYLCEYFYRQALPIARFGIPKLTELLVGKGSRGGGEYLGVADAWQRAEASVGYFTQYYARNSYEAFKARSAEEAGQQIVCDKFLSLRYPDGSGLLDAITTPDSPAQFYGRFDEIPYTTVTNPPQSQYKVYYHIYAGNYRGAYYRVYFKGGLGSSFYQDNIFRIDVATGYVSKGDYVSNTEDFIAPSGYKELCIMVNGQEECGFKEVTTSFAANYITNKYAAQQASQTDIRTESTCVSGTASVYALLNPNIQAGVEDVISPSLYNQGIIRICATRNPGEGTDALAGMEDSRWIEVGYCGDVNLKCWLDKQSVENAIDFKNIEEDVLNVTSTNYQRILQGEGGYLDDKSFKSEIEKIGNTESNQEKISLINKIINKVYYNNQKAPLLYLRGNAYGAIAIALYKKYKAQQPLEEESEEGEEIIEEITEEGEVIKVVKVVTSPKFEIKRGLFTKNFCAKYFQEEWYWSLDCNNVGKEPREVEGYLTTRTTATSDWIPATSLTNTEGRNPNEDDQRLINGLKDKDFYQGLSILVNKAIEEKRLIGGNAEMSNDNIFQLNVQNLRGIRFKYSDKDNSWLWSLEGINLNMKDAWQDLDKTNHPVVAVAELNSYEKGLLSSLQGKGFIEGAKLLFWIDFEVQESEEEFYEGVGAVQGGKELLQILEEQKRDLGWENWKDVEGYFPEFTGDERNVVINAKSCNECENKLSNNCNMKACLAIGFKLSDKDGLDKACVYARKDFGIWKCEEVSLKETECTEEIISIATDKIGEDTLRIYKGEEVYDNVCATFVSNVLIEAKTLSRFESCSIESTPSRDTIIELVRIFEVEKFTEIGEESWEKNLQPGDVIIWGCKDLSVCSKKSDAEEYQHITIFKEYAGSGGITIIHDGGSKYKITDRTYSDPFGKSWYITHVWRGKCAE